MRGFQRFMGGAVGLAWMAAVLGPALPLSAQNCAAPVWVEGPNAPKARGSFAMATDPDTNRLVVFGGFNGTTREYYADTWEFQGQLWRFVNTPGPSARDDMPMSYDSTRRRTVLYGGFNGSSILTDTWEYNSLSSTWSLISPAANPGPRRYASMAFDPQRNQTILFGGLLNGTPNAETWIYNGTNWQQSSATGPSARRTAAMAYDPVGRRIVLFGGLNGSTFLNDTWAWNGTAWSQIPGAGPSARHAASMAYDPARGVLRLIGGDSAAGLSNEVWELNANTWTQFTTTDLPPRAFHQVAYDYSRGQFAAFGGVGRVGNTFPFLADLRFLVGQSWTLSTNRIAPSPRVWTAGAYDIPRGFTVLFGGSSGGNLLADTWLWNGATWTSAAPIFAPSPRQRHAMAFDTARDRTVLFGGLTAGGASDETWFFDGVNWSQLSVAVSPSARSGHAMAYDSSRNNLILFGGDEANPNNQTWVLISGFWAQLNPFGANPVPRVRHSMTFDSARGRIILFGGTNATGALGDTWEWDGGTWNQASTTGPAPRSGHTITYDRSRNRTVLYGGVDGAGVRLADVWEWNGAVWEQRPANTLGTPAPNARFGHAAAFDASRGVPLFIAGDDISTGNPPITNGGDDELWELRSSAPSITNSIINRSRPAGSNLTLEAAVANGSGATFQWRRAGTALTDSGNISGATTSRLTIANISQTDAARYDCLVTNACGTSQSSRCTLTIGCAADYDDGSGRGRPDGGIGIEDILYYIPIWQSGSLTADLDDGSLSGTPDGGTTIEDLLYYLARYDAGC